MSGTTTKLTAAVQEYFADLRRVRASGGATQERSLYGPLGNLLTAVGATLRPKVFCVQELADQGAGHPDFGLYAAKQVQRGMPREGQTPERGGVEVKSPADDAWLTASSDQASRYWGRYRLVLVTNARDFVLVGADTLGKPTTLENVPAAVWAYKLVGYQVLKKWLSYRERRVLDRALTHQEVQRFTEIARRIAAMLTTAPNSKHPVRTMEA